MSSYAEIPQHIKDLADARAEIERLHLRLQEAAKLNLELMKIRHTNEVEIERLREVVEQSPFDFPTYRAATEAEIERLNSELLAERLANIGKVHPCDDSTATNLASALADNERLRGLLREGDEKHHRLTVVTSEPAIFHYWKRVREALGKL